MVEAGQEAAAEKILLRLVRKTPADFSLLADLGALQLQMGRAEKAEQSLSKALDLQPDSISVINNLATLKAQTGENDAAEALYRQVLKHAPNEAETYLDLAKVKRFAVDDVDIAAMERAFAGHDADSEGAMYIGFALAKAYEEIGENDQAFEHLIKANTIKRQSLVFDINAEEALVDHIIATKFDGYANDDPESVVPRRGKVKPIFIVGMPRSGTTLLEQILAAHSQVWGGGELNLLRRVIIGDARYPGMAGYGVAKRGFPEGLGNLNTEAYDAMARDYLQGLPKVSSGVSRITDKMPSNFMFAGMIPLMFPNATIIHARRSPMDICLSCYAIHFPYGQSFSYDLVELGRYYRLYSRLMEHWHRVMPGRMLDVRYENVVENPETEARRLIGFAGLDWQDQCLDFHKSRRHVATASAQQVREPVHKRSLARWRKFAAHLEPLRDALGSYADAETSPEL